MSILPISDPIALKQSETLLQYIRTDILKAGGYISFARFMEQALYQPGLGYYSAGAHKFGAGGDFITAPEISPLFAHCLAKQCQSILQTLGQGNILELGAGSGRLAADLLQELHALNSLPKHYFILEISADLRKRQQEYLKKHCPHLLNRISWLNTLPTELTGIIFANEVMDALPVHCFAIDMNGNVLERGVSIKENHLDWHYTAPSATLLNKLQDILSEMTFSPGYASEVNTLLAPWIASLAAALKQGVILLCDYGFGRREYYHPDRHMGTLMCFHQHQAHSNPFLHVGLQDITAHVDFTTVAENAVSHGLKVEGFITQAAFLLNCGILEGTALADQVDNYNNNQAIKKLILPSEMGEIMKVIALSKGWHDKLSGFSLYDRRHDL